MSASQASLAGDSAAAGGLGKQLGGCARNAVLGITLNSSRTGDEDNYEVSVNASSLNFSAVVIAGLSTKR